MLRKRVVKVLRQPIKAYEQEMFSRAEMKMKKSRKNLNVLFADDVAERIVSMFKSFGPPAPP